MKDKAVQRQVRLPTGKAVEIALKSLRVRMGRSVLTLVTIGMSIAFLANVWMSRVVEGAAVNGGLTAANAAGTGVARTVWLLGLSLLVCLVGISNAMLMSVMERFREIGTMKCLGALDGFILKLFFLESVFLGVAGSVSGGLLGMGLTVLLVRQRYGVGVWEVMPWGGVWGVAGASAGIGVVITAVAAMYPAWKAARMEPIAAMRVDV